MQSKPIVWKTCIELIAMVMLVGCSATPAATPTQAPTVDLQPTFDAIAKHAVETMTANMTLNAPTATLVIPTDTPLPPTNTVPPLPTETPAPTETPTRVFIPWTSTPTSTPVVYGCAITGVSPSSSDKIVEDQDFDGKWSLKNIGTKTWLAGNTDISYSSGTRFQQDTDLVDLTSDVAPNGTYTVTIDMRAPDSDGTYTTTWLMHLEDGSSCELTMTINVSNDD